MADARTPSASGENPDLGLIKQALGGSERAYETLVDKYRKSVYYLALKMVRNTEDAEDLTQEAFVKAFNNLSGFDPKYAFSTWLFRIATNACIDHIRRKRLQTLSIEAGYQNEDGETSVLQIEDGNLTPEELYRKSQRKTYLGMALERLPDRYKRLVKLRYFDELSYEEVAQELELPLGTVKAQLHRARELLNHELAIVRPNL